MTTTTDITGELTAVLRDMGGPRSHAPELAAALLPLVERLLADATAHGFRQGFQAGRTLTRQRGMS